MAFSAFSAYFISYFAETPFGTWEGMLLIAVEYLTFSVSPVIAETNNFGLMNLVNILSSSPLPINKG